MAALDDEAVDMLGVVGDAGECRDRIRAFIEAGVGTPIINAIATDPDEAETAMEAFVPANFP